MKRVKLSLAVAAMVFSVHAGAASVTHTFNTGDPALAGEINQNFQDLVDAINSSGAGSTSFGSEYFIQPSSTGDLSARNVIVLKRESNPNTDNDSDGDGTNDTECNEDIYDVRVFFNNTQPITVNNASSNVTPDKVWIFGFVCADEDNPTVANFQQEYVYALPNSSTGNPTGGFDEAQGIEVNVDDDMFPGAADGTFENSNSYDYVQTRASVPLNGVELVNSTDTYIGANDVILSSHNFSSLRSAYPRPVQIPTLGETFNDVVVETLNGYGKRSTRYFASGVGLIREQDGGFRTQFGSFRDNGPGFNSPVFQDYQVTNAIYYRIDGVTNGSLANTPFASGGTSAGQWFSQ